MLEAKYYKDYRHNYMILQCGREAASKSYQYKILTSGKIDEILRCSVRHVNGITYYYYDISSRTTLESLYRGKKMSGRQVKDALWQIHRICDRLSGYFMEEAGLVLLPEHIYYDMTNQKYIGLYYPDYERDGEEVYRPLMDFLLEHIDTDDRKLTETLYQIYEMSEEPCFSLEDALRIFEDSEQTEFVEIHTTLYDRKEAAPSGEYEARQKDGSSCDGARCDEKPVQAAAYAENCDVENWYEESSYHEKPSDDGPNDDKPVGRSLYYPICAVASLLGMAGVFAVYRFYELTQQEEIALYGAMAVMGACFFICLAGTIRGGKRKKRGSNGKKTASENENLFSNSEPVSLEHVLDRDMNLGMADTISVQMAGSKGSAASSAASGTALDNSRYGNTVFFDRSKIGEGKLYAVDKKNKKHIELGQFPCTVGKMAGCVDYVLPDESVSRIHARFDRDGEKVLLTDMNSTNGTFKNGLRMQPKETVEIEPGDEVRFGNLNYCYR